MQYPAIKVIPQKLTLPMNVFETFPECSLPSTVLKNNKNDRSPCSLKRGDGQSYPIYVCTRANHARYGSRSKLYFALAGCKVYHYTLGKT